MRIHNPFSALTKFEMALWLCSLFLVGASFFAGGSGDYLTLAATLVGVTGLIFVAKGDVTGQVLTVVFSLLYAVISYEYRYYGEMITYLGMTSPIAVMSIVSWLRHPYGKGKNEVKVGKLTPALAIWMAVLAIIFTAGFYFILRAFGTANLIVSTISVTTSFAASYLMLFRIPAYAVAYAANDIVLITLWVAAAAENMSYLPMVVCFVIFLINDIYGFYSWTKMRERQRMEEDFIECAGQPEARL